MTTTMINANTIFRIKYVRIRFGIIGVFPISLGASERLDAGNSRAPSSLHRFSVSDRGEPARNSKSLSHIVQNWTGTPAAGSGNYQSPPILSIEGRTA
jgi:hypothetical protein